MNKITLLGRITKRPELQQVGQYNKTEFVVAVNRQFKNKDGNYEADFITCMAWNKQAEVIAKYFNKGDRILLNGRLETGSYENKEGQRNYYTKVIVEELHFIETREKKQEVTPSDFVERTPEQILNDDIPF